MGVLKKLKKKLAATLAMTMSMTFMAATNYAKAETVNKTVDNQKIIGYYTSWSWSGAVDNIQFDKLTHINYAFLIPQKDGSVLPIENESMMKDMISKAHNNGVKVLISVGGWSYQNIPLQSTFEAMANNETSRKAFVKNVVDFVNKYDFDGADIDWEYPTAAQASNFEEIILSLRTELDKNNKLLTAAVSAGVMPNGGDSGNGNGITSKALEAMDWINIMAYDGGNGATHSPYSFAENALNYWTKTKGVPKEKAIVGVPFYARPSWSNYNEIVAKDPEAPYKDQSGSDYYNGLDTMKKKATLAKNNGGGIMIWELAGDTTDDSTSLLSAIYSVLGNTSGGETDKTPLKATLSNDNYSNASSYTVTINLPASNKASKVALYENDVLVAEFTANGSNAESFTKSFTNKNPGSYSYYVKSSNDTASVNSDNMVITVKDSSTGGETVVTGNTKVVGYFTDWTSGSVDEVVQFDKLTHINYAFLIPMEDGNVRPIDQPEKLKELVAKAHNNGVKVLISVGGWSYQNAELDPVFVKLAADDTSRENLVNNIVKFVNEYNLDGADIDWEYPDPGTESDNYLKLMTSLHNKLNGKLLTAAVTAGVSPWNPGETWTAKGITADIFPLVDFLNIMAYDGGSGAEHSPYSFAEDALKVWTEKGLPKEKMVLGVPFYSRPGWKTYKEIVAADPEAPNKDQSGQEYYNGIDTIKKKTELALEMGSGVMIWELSQDTTDDTSLLKAINSVTGPLHSTGSYEVEDVNKDGVVDLQDLSLVANAYRANTTSSNWNSNYDINKDNVIDIVDIVMVAKKIA